MKNTNDLIKNEKIIAVGYDYLTDDGRIITRVVTGRRGRTIKWKIDGDNFLYRSLFEAYFGLKF